MEQHPAIDGSVAAEADDRDDSTWVSSLLASDYGKTYRIDADPEAEDAVRRAAAVRAQPIVNDVIARVRVDRAGPAGN